MQRLIFKGLANSLGLEVVLSQLELRHDLSLLLPRAHAPSFDFWNVRRVVKHLVVLRALIESICVSSGSTKVERPSSQKLGFSGHLSETLAVLIRGDYRLNSHLAEG